MSIIDLERDYEYQRFLEWLGEAGLTEGDWELAAGWAREQSHERQERPEGCLQAHS